MKKWYSICTLFLVLLVSITNVYAHSISGTLSSDETKCHINQYVNGAGKITTYIKCYVRHPQTKQSKLHNDDSTVYSGAGRKFFFTAPKGYKFKIEYKNYHGRVWIIRNNSSKLAESLISY